MSAKWRVVAAAAGLAVVAAPAAAEDEVDVLPGEWSANVAGTTDYRFRGISQTDNLPAIQGGFDYGLTLSDYVGVYAGVWGSNVDFDDGDEATVEIDAYGGLAGQIEGIDWSLGGIYYAYPGAESSLDYNYWEIAASAGYDFDVLAVTGGYNYSPEFFGASGDAHYLYGGVTVPIPVAYSPYISAQVGRQWIADNGIFGTPDYLDWKVAVGARVEGLTLELAYIDTDLSQGECFGGADLCDPAAIFTLSKAFGDDPEGETDLIPGDFSANVAGVTDYRFRGISQTDNLPAVQGGFDYEVTLADPVSLYAGSWASNVDFDDGDEATVEIDTYGGLAGAVEGVDWSLGGIYYAYPGAESSLDYDYWEVAAGAGYDFEVLAVSGGYNYSPDFFGGSGDAHYVYGDVTVPVPFVWPHDTYIAGHVGRQMIAENGTFGTPDYVDWSVSLGATIEGLDVAITYYDTNIDASRCFGGTDLCNAAAVFSVSKTF